MAGNHDVSLQPTPHNINWYEKNFGKAWYQFEHKGSLFIVLESNLLRDGKGAPKLAEKQLVWLKNTLRNAGDGHYIHKMAFMHHPLCVHAVDEKDDYHPPSRRCRRALVIALSIAGTSQRGYS